MCYWADAAGRPLNMGQPLWRASEVDAAARDPKALVQAIAEDIVRTAVERHPDQPQAEAVARFLGTEQGLAAYASYKAARRRAGLA